MDAQTQPESRGTHVVGRLAYVLGEFPSLTETFILRELTALRDEGLSPLLFALRRPPPGQPIHAAAVPWLTEITYPCHPLRHACRAAALTWRLFPARTGQTLRNPRVFARRLRCAGCALEFAAVAGNTGIGHVHAHFLHAPAETGVVLASLVGAGFSLSAHAWDIYTPAAGEQAPLVAAAQRLFVCSAHGQAFLQQRFPDFPPEKIELAYHGLPLSEFAPGNPEPGHIVAVGRLEEKKGFADLLDALAELRRRTIRFRCTLVGRGSCESRLQDRCRRLGLTAHVTFAGSADQTTVQELLRRAALLVMPSIALANGDRDGLPTVVLEAMACSVPVISTTANAAGEIIQSGVNGWLVAPAAPLQLAEALAGLLADAGARKRLGQAGRSTLERQFGLNQAIRPLAAFFRARSALT